MILEIKNNINKILSAVIPAIFLSACGWVTEDLEPCAPAPDTKTIVNFIYDYNMQHTDLFTDHVGSVYLYVFDGNGKYVTRREKHRSDMTGVIDFSIPFDTTEIRPGETYQFVAVAQANHEGYTASLETPGFTLISEMTPGISTIDDYRLKLDRDDDGDYDFGIVDYKDAYGNTETMIDTIWTTKPDEVQIVNIPSLDYKPSLVKEPDRVVEVTVPMMRITNSIKVNLLNTAFTSTTSPDDYIVLIDFPNGNGTIDFTGTTYPAQELYYRALRKTIMPYSQAHPSTKAEDAAEDDRYTLQSVFGVSRMQVTDGSSLQIRDGQTLDLIAEIPEFAKFLADYFAHGFDDDQEFLDREYDFTIDVEIEDGRMVSFRGFVNILGWGRRIQFVTL